MNERPDMQDWEAQINALLDGELDEPGADALKAAARNDQSLARAIIEAYQLQQALAALPMERAPASLRRKLRRIPRERREPWLGFLLQPRWAGGMALLAVLALLLTQLGPRTPSDEEIAKARQELAVAFAYLDKVGARTELEIESTVGAEMNEAVTDTMVRTLKEQFAFDKENKA